MKAQKWDVYINAEWNILHNSYLTILLKVKTEIVAKYRLVKIITSYSIGFFFFFGSTYNCGYCDNTIVSRVKYWVRPTYHVIIKVIKNHEKLFANKNRSTNV